jgi:shikimate dehydrogenase
MTDARSLRLGLIGDNITQSQAPRLHRLAGAQHGITVTYDRLVPKDLGQSFDQVFARCQSNGYRGINVTYPYKELVVPKLRIEDPLVRAIGAVNTVIFGHDDPVGHNTDYSGFVAAYARIRQDCETGPVLLIGTGGVGRAVAFGLVALGTADLRLVDRDQDKARSLAAALKSVQPEMKITISDDVIQASEGAAGLINCTPVGMVGYEGTPLPHTAMANAEWAFDAVYTPADTQFLIDAAAQGLSVISGWELFFYQGVHAWAFFSGVSVDEAQMRKDLLAGKDILQK